MRLLYSIFNPIGGVEKLSTLHGVSHHLSDLSGVSDMRHAHFKQSAEANYESLQSSRECTDLVQACKQYLEPNKHGETKFRFIEVSSEKIENEFPKLRFTVTDENGKSYEKFPTFDRFIHQLYDSTSDYNVQMQADYDLKSSKVFKFNVDYEEVPEASSEEDDLDSESDNDDGSSDNSDDLDEETISLSECSDSEYTSVDENSEIESECSDDSSIVEFNSELLVTDFVNFSATKSSLSFFSI